MKHAYNMESFYVNIISKQNRFMKHACNTITAFCEKSK